MKIKTADMPYETVAALPAEKHVRPKKPNMFFRTLLYAVSAPELHKTRFKCEKTGMERLKRGEACLYLMNHSSFIDLKIAATVLYPQPFNIVCTSDGFVGKRRLMRNLGCIPTKKFITDSVLVRDMLYSVKKLKCSVLMYPEASYSFDGTATSLPEGLGKCLKMLDVPVVMIKTAGAFAHDPLYNNLQQRRVNVTAGMEYILSREDIAAKSAEELNAILNKHFSFDNFRWQQENRVKINEPFRADGLNRVLYKCPHCLSEEHMSGSGITLTCKNCGAGYILDEYGFLKAQNTEARFTHVPDWYAWQRECIREEIKNGTYRLSADVDIFMLVNTDCVYRVGEGRLEHTKSGFHLTGCGGALDFSMPPQASYSLYSDYFWYEIGDMICIGDTRTLYYCFPKNKKDVVARTRLAAEELYKLV